MSEEIQLKLRPRPPADVEHSKDIVDAELFWFDIKHDILQDKFGPAILTGISPAPWQSWIMAATCGLHINIFCVEHLERAIVYANWPQLNHIIRHLDLPSQPSWRIDTENPDQYKAIVKPSPVELKRIDDNGVEYSVGLFDFEEEAQCRLAEFESHRHKQTYFITQHYL